MLNLLQERFQPAARRTLKVPVLFQCDRGIGRPTRVFFLGPLLGSGHRVGNSCRLRTLRPVKQDARSECAQSDHCYDDKRKNAFQGWVNSRKG